MNIIFIKTSHSHVTFFFKASLVLLKMIKFSYLMLKNMMESILQNIDTSFDNSLEIQLGLHILVKNKHL